MVVGNIHMLVMFVHILTHVVIINVRCLIVVNVVLEPMVQVFFKSII